MGFKGRDSVRDGFKVCKYLQRTVCMCWKGFCLPSNVQEDQPYSTRQIKKVKTPVQNFFGKNLVMRAEHF